jgi:hypothetical protein
MRLKEIQAKTPQQQRIDALKRNADTAKNMYKNEKKKLQIQQTQQRLQKLKSIGAVGS